MKNRLLVLCLPLCGVASCGGERTSIGGGPHQPRDVVADDGGVDASSDQGSGNEGSEGSYADAGSDTNSSVGTDSSVVDSGLTIGDGGLQEGDYIGHEVVIDVWHNGDCTEIELQEPKAPFECSEEQLAALMNRWGSDVPEAPTAEGATLGKSSCTALADLQRPRLRQELDRWLDSSYLGKLAQHCLPGTRTMVFYEGQEVDRCPNDRDWDAGVGETPDEGEGEASEYSTTNTQVPGVDEADYIKNDGDTIYVLHDESLVVFDAWPVEELVEIARVPLPAEPRRMFLTEDRLVVYLRVDGDTWTEEPCTYGYDCRSSSETGSTLVQIYDVSLPELPELLKEYEMSGAYLASRRIGDAVFSVVHDGPVKTPPSADTDLDGATPDALDEQYAQKKAAIAELVDGLPVEYFVPSITERDPFGTTTTTSICDEVLATSASRGTSFVSVVGFDLATLDAPSSTLIASKPGFVYASPQALYLAIDGVDGQDDTFSAPWSYNDVEDDRTTVYKFALDGIHSTYHGSQTIPGHVLNQFSMDEHENVLRVATTNGWTPDPSASSNVVTLGEQNGEFAVLGQLRGLAPSEDIRAVRFDGDRGFVVTFKQTDPLYAIGLSDPAAPAVLGELQIPGFSTYIHMLDATHLLTVGVEPDEDGRVAYFTGIQIQIFDVYDLSEPTLKHKAVIGTQGSGSDALLNHLAFNYFPSRQLLALPATICGGEGNGGKDDEAKFSGLVVFDVSLENGLTERGRLPFANIDEAEPEYPSDCADLWGYSSSFVKRSIFMEDYAIGVSNDWLKAAALSELGTVLSSVKLGQ